MITVTGIQSNMAQPVQMAVAGFGAAFTIVTVLMVSNVITSYVADGKTLTGMIDDKLGGMF